jgi:hypothetical protein
MIVDVGQFKAVSSPPALPQETWEIDHEWIDAQGRNRVELRAAAQRDTHRLTRARKCAIMAATSKKERE